MLSSPVLLAALLSYPSADYELVRGYGTDPAAPSRVRKTVLPRAGGNASTTQQADGFLATVENGVPHFRALGPLGVAGEPDC